MKSAPPTCDDEGGKVGQPSVYGGSMPAMFGPLFKLHRGQARQRLEAIVRPPCWRADDAIERKTEAVDGLPSWQYSQLFSARPRTFWSRSASIGVTRLVRDDAGIAALGLEYGQKVGHSKVL